MADYSAEGSDITAPIYRSLAQHQQGQPAAGAGGDSSTTSLASRDALISPNLAPSLPSSSHIPAISEEQDAPAPVASQASSIAPPATAGSSVMEPPPPANVRRSKSFGLLETKPSKSDLQANPSLADGSVFENGDDSPSRAGAVDPKYATVPAHSNGGETSDNESMMSVREILQPGGFRRDFVIRQGGGQARPDLYAPDGLADHGLRKPSRFTRSFGEFLRIYGHFGGEDLEEIDEDDDEDDVDEFDEEEEELLAAEEGQQQQEGTMGRRGVRVQAPTDGTGSRAPGERTPLLRHRSTGRERERSATGSITSGGPRSSRPRMPSRGSSISRKRGTSVGGPGGAQQNRAGTTGDATVTQAVLMLLKSFVGTGVLFLGKAFFNGGILFSAVTLVFVALVSLYSFLLLVKTRLIIHGSFGDIGGVLYGKWMRYMILTSIILSQVGFVAAYTIFVAENLQAFVMAVTKCRAFVATGLLILAQLVIYLPLAMIRNIEKLSGTALIADVFILLGIVYIFGHEIKLLATDGLADVKLFNPDSFPLLIGTAVFAFEGVGLVIPITESMREPHKFPGVLSGVMIGVMLLFGGAGVLAYATYGSDIETVVFVNLPQDDKLVNTAQFLYSMAILLSTPLQLFPAVRIMENGIFVRSGKRNTRVKWMKNAFRFTVTIACALIAWIGASDLDKFVSLIGSVACVPLCFCYPALLHYKACATTRRQKAIDVALCVFGLLAAIYTTTQTIMMLSKGGSGGSPKFGDCPPRE